METNKILQADLLDIIFDGRNKNYGAYELRRSYSKRVIIALSATFATVAAIAGIVTISERDKVHKNIMVVTPDINISDAKPKEITKPITPPSLPKAQPIKVRTIAFTPPKITHDMEVTEKDKPPVISDIDNLKISTVTNTKGSDGDVVTLPLEKSTGGGSGKGFKIGEDGEGTKFTPVQIQARYPGGPDAWKRFLERTLRQDIPTENGASTGRYTVIVSFIVDKEGNTSEIQADTDPGYGTAAEAIRVIKSSGKWQPAEQNGHKVIYRQKQAITFVVQEN